MDLGITSNGGGVIRVMSGGRSMNQRLKKREKEESATSYAKEKKGKDGMEWAMNKEKKRPTDSLGLVRVQKKKNRGHFRNLISKKRPLIDDLFYLYI